MLRSSSALLLCLLTSGHAFRLSPAAKDVAEEHADCCCKAGPCKEGQQDWDESMKYNILQNKCCKFRNKNCEQSWMDWHPYTEKANKDMCETPKSSCARSWKGVHFDTLVNSTSCAGDSCVAFEISEESDYPLLTVHMGSYWAVKKNKSGAIDWKPMPANPKATQGMFVLNLREIDQVKKMSDGRLVFEKGGYQVMVINSGLYHDEHYVMDGVRALDSMERRNASKETSLLEAETNSQLAVASDSQSAGFFIGALVVGGYYSAATASGVAVSNTAVTGAFLIVGGGLAGVGAILAGPVAGPALLVAVFLRAQEVEEDSAAKVWSMLKCHSDFKVCSEDTIVPAKKECPEE